MSTDKDSRQSALASVHKSLDPNLSDAALVLLSRSDEVKVRAAVAEQLATPLTTLLKLAVDSSPAVRAGVARNERTDVPVELHKQLADDKAVEVIYALIENPAVPNQIIGRLARHFHKEYASAARKRLASRDGANSMLSRFGIAGPS